MCKGLAVSAVCVVLLSSVAVPAWSSGISQLQGYSLGPAFNAVRQIADGAVSSNNVLTLAESQLATDDIRHTTAYQGTAGSLLQSAGAVSMSGDFGVTQFGDIDGVQMQVPSSGTQLQNLNANLDQDVYKIGGSGSALGLETFVGIQTQLTFTPYGATANVQGIGTTLYDAVGGGPTSSMTIGGGANIGVGQSSF